MSTVNGGNMTALDLPAEYTDWSALAQRCDSTEGLSAFEREQVKRAIAHIGRVLGPSFLRDAVATRHPIMHEVFNHAPWTRRWFIWLADSMRLLSDSGNFDGLVERLRSSNRAAEALSVLRFGASFARAGFQVAFDPRVVATRKVPDIELIHEANNERIYLEVSALRESRISKAASHTSWAIVAPVLRAAPFLNYSGRIHKSLSESHLNDVVRKVEALARASTDGFQQLILSGVLELGLAPEKDQAILGHWAETRGMKVGSLEGPPFGVDEIERVRSAMNREQQQLPGDCANILILEAPFLFISAGSGERVVSALEEAVYDHPHILAAVITSSHMGSGDAEARMFGQHGYLRKVRCDVLVDEHLLLLNRFCSFKVSPAAVSDLYRAFWQ